MAKKLKTERLKLKSGRKEIGELKAKSLKLKTKGRETKELKAKNFPGERDSALQEEPKVKGVGAKELKAKSEKLKAGKTGKKEEKSAKKAESVEKKSLQKKKAKKLPKAKKAIVKSEISLKDLLEAGCHFGHRKSKINPRVKRYIYTVRDGIAIFDLAKTKEQLEKAKKFTSDLVAKGGRIVFVGTKRQAGEIIREEAKRVGMPYVVSRWLGGTITNWEEIKKNSIDKLNRWKKNLEEGKYNKRPKKEQSVIKRELSRLERIVGGLAGLDKLFDAIFVVDIKAEKTAVMEARNKGIPVVAIVDSNCDPTEVDYPIPANDDAAKSIQFIVGEVGKAVKE